MKERVVVVCPGRGSYTKETLGYLSSHQSSISDFIKDIDARRAQDGELTISELDGMDKYKTHVHSKGEHASSLIYSCSYADFQSIDQSKYEIVAITGNSMGWYIALALAKALDWAGSYELIQTMGSMMKEGLIGGQIIYPIVDENWLLDLEKRALVENEIKKANELGEAYISIELGGYLVIAGDSEALRYLLKALPFTEPYPFQLVNHGAFHTPLLRSVAQRAFEKFSPELFSKPEIPLIDGRGHIWSPLTTSRKKLYKYTLGHQVVEKYDFTASLSIAMKEFAPDKIILLGPGNSLGGVIGQSMIMNSWHDIKSKADFSQRQKTKALLISMGLKA